MIGQPTVYTNNVLSPKQLGSLMDTPKADTVSNASFLQGFRAPLSSRKQSIDFASARGINNLAATVGGGLLPSNRGSNSIISAARN